MAQLKEDGNLYLIGVYNTNGYKKCRIKINNTFYEYRVHRLIAYLFVYNDDIVNKTDINHKNEFEKFNNKVSNLEWATPKQNANYGTKNERDSMTQIINNQKRTTVSKHIGVKRDDVKRKVKVINIQTYEVFEFDSIYETAITLNIPKHIVNKYCQRNSIYNNEFKFEYNDDLGIVKRKLRTKGLEPIIRLNNEYQFENFYLYRSLLEDKYKIQFVIDACLCKGNSIYYGSRWMFLSEYNRYLKDNNQDIITISPISIVRVATCGYKFMKLYTDLYDLINEDIDIDHVIRSCNKNHNFSTLIKNHYTWMYLEDYLRYKNYNSLDELTKNDRINPKLSKAISKNNQLLKDKHEAHVNNIMNSVYERIDK